jgi:MoxR-like ATPase
MTGKAKKAAENGAQRKQGALDAARAKLEQIRQWLRGMLYERDDEIDGLLCCLLAAQHAVLLGPPGTAKSVLARAVCESVESATFFERLLTKFTTPEEVFGAMSLKGLENDEFRRVTTGKLPECHIGFLDETFKANSAILNSLLSLMNERLFHNGNGAPVQCPLISLIGASNEMPEDESLAALYDRFMIRFKVSYIADRDKRRRMLRGNIGSPPVRLTLDDLELLQSATASVQISNDALDAMLDAADDVGAVPVVVSDRRVKASVELVKAHAFLNGAKSVDPEDDLMILAHAWWNEPAQIAKVRDAIGKRVSPLTSEARAILDAAKGASKSAIDCAPQAGSDQPTRMRWVTTATTARGALQEMHNRLADMIDEHKATGARTAKAEHALAKIEELADGLTAKSDDVLAMRQRRAARS